MKSSALFIGIISGLLGAGSISAHAAGKEVEALKVATESAASGDGNSVTLQGNAMPLSGAMLLIGHPLTSSDA